MFRFYSKNFADRGLGDFPSDQAGRLDQGRLDQWAHRAIITMNMHENEITLHAVT